MKPRRFERRDENDRRPFIPLVPGKIGAIVDAAESALIAEGVLFQRSNKIVFVAEAPVITADQNEIRVPRISERGDHALVEDLARVACFVRFDLRSKSYSVVNPPSWIVKTLRERTGRLRFQVLSGIINAPTLRPDGSLLSNQGYDARTGLFFDPRGTDFGAIQEHPSRADAEQALKLLDDLLSEFPFVAKADRSVALSTILTACVRPAVATAPMHAFTSPVAGSGKSKLVDIASVISTGREASVISQGSTDEETEKRLGSILRAGHPLVSVDNCGKPLGGEFLCQMLTQTIVRVRTLGLSEAPEYQSRAFVTATGNNLVIEGDMTRRTMMCRLDPRTERPELRTFEFESVARAKADRARYVVAALTVLRAFHSAGLPQQAAVLGSFEEWSRLVRDGLVWMGRADPVDTMELTRASDSRLSDHATILPQWLQVIGIGERVSARRLAEKASESSEMLHGPKYAYPDFRDALLAVAGSGSVINNRRLGKWLMSNASRIIGGLSIESAGKIDGYMTYRLLAKKVDKCV